MIHTGNLKLLWQCVTELLHDTQRELVVNTNSILQVLSLGDWLAYETDRNVFSPSKGTIIDFRICFGYHHACMLFLTLPKIVLDHKDSISYGGTITGMYS